MKDSKWNGKRIIALVGIILIVIMVIATLITAIVDKSGLYFRSCLFITIALPLAIWVFIWGYGAMLNKHTMASLDLFKGEDSEDSIDSGEDSNE